MQNSPPLHRVKWELSAGNSWVWGPVKPLVCGTVMPKLKNSVLHSLNVYDLSQRLEDTAFPSCHVRLRN